MLQDICKDLFEYILKSHNKISRNNLFLYDEDAKIILSDLIYLQCISLNIIYLYNQN